jgi:hypothetical protein
VIGDSRKLVMVYMIPYGWPWVSYVNSSERTRRLFLCIHLSISDNHDDHDHPDIWSFDSHPWIYATDWTFGRARSLDSVQSSHLVRNVISAKDLVSSKFSRLYDVWMKSEASTLFDFPFSANISSQVLTPPNVSISSNVSNYVRFGIVVYLLIYAAFLLTIVCLKLNTLYLLKTERMIETHL